MKTIVFILFISTALFGQTKGLKGDSLLYKQQYELGLLSKADYEYLLKAKAELVSIKGGSMDEIVLKKRKQTLIDNLRSLFGENKEPTSIQPSWLRYGPNIGL